MYRCIHCGSTTGETIAEAQNAAAQEHGRGVCVSRPYDEEEPELRTMRLRIVEQLERARQRNSASRGG